MPRPHASTPQALERTGALCGLFARPGRWYNFTVSSNDDHAVKQIDLYVDGVYKTTTQCDDVAYTCQLYYTWSAGSSGQHTATLKSSNWLGNVATLTVGFTVA